MDPKILQIIPANPGLFAVYNDGSTEPVEVFALVEKNGTQEVLPMTWCDGYFSTVSEWENFSHLERRG